MDRQTCHFNTEKEKKYLKGTGVNRERWNAAGSRVRAPREAWRRTPSSGHGLGVRLTRDEGGEAEKTSVCSDGVKGWCAAHARPSGVGRMDGWMKERSTFWSLS